MFDFKFTHTQRVKQITAKQGALQQAGTGEMGYEKERAREEKSENCQKNVMKIKFKNIIKTESNTVTINRSANKYIIFFLAGSQKLNKPLEI